MPFSVPTLPQLRQQIRGYLQARLGTNPTLRASNANVFADGQAGLVYLELGYMNFMASQLFVENCDGVYLDRYGARYGLARLGATAAAGSMTIQGTNGRTIPAFWGLLGPDGVTTFATQAAGTISGGSVTVPVAATTLGAVGNLATGASISLVTAIAGIAPSGTVASPGFTGGADEESNDAFRARILYRQKNPPRGGATSDYYAWTKLLPGATRAWVYPLRRGPGTCDVTFTMDARSNIIPLSADITALHAIMDPLLPVGANRVTAPPTYDAYIFAATANTVNVTVHNLVPNTPAVQAAVQASLTDLFLTKSTPGGATIGDGVDANDPAGTLYLDEIYGAIETAAGVANFELTAPTADVVVSSGTLSVLGSVTFT